MPFEVGNALTAMMKKSALKKEEVATAWEAVQQIPVDLRHTEIKSALKLAIEHSIKTKATTKDILEAVRESRERFAEALKIDGQGRAVLL